MEKELYKIIVRPLFSEKTTGLRDSKNIYCFQVDKQATKQDVKEALKKIYNVNIVKCNIVNVPGKKKRRRFVEGRTSSWKKAYVKLKQGEKIDIGV
ncbi:MAG: 50S ribosomal protein L23 [Spirochaetes bacterium]|nr:50S ribosomal protein L23 [Spirochaetota bacterium]